MMIVEQTKFALDLGEAEDTIAAWRAIPGFMLAYVKDTVWNQESSLSPLLVVGLFTCQDGVPVKGQRKVHKTEIDLETWPGGHSLK